MKHKHFDQIIAWASGEKIEVWDPSRFIWIETMKPIWDQSLVYRIKPRQPEDIIEYRSIKHSSKTNLDNAFDNNVKCVFDSKTLELTNIEIVR